MAVRIELRELDTSLARIPPGRRGHLLMLERANRRRDRLRELRAEGQRCLAWWVAGLLGIGMWSAAIWAGNALLTWLGVR